VPRSKPAAKRNATGPLPELPLAGLTKLVRELRSELCAAEVRNEALIQAMPGPRQASARNLFHYLALRRRDIRATQAQLAAVGLSSLGRAESNTLFVVDAVLAILERLQDRGIEEAAVDMKGFQSGSELLASNTEALLGPKRTKRDVRIMVTMPSEAAHDYALVKELLSHGMDAMRINCAHDGPEEWAAIIEKLRRAEREVGRHCQVLMDLGGPKLRTGPIATCAAVVSWRPRRDHLGKVISPARIWLTRDAAAVPPPIPADASLPVSASWLEALAVDDRLALTDTRGAARTLRVVGQDEGGWWVTGKRSSYVVDGTELHNQRTGETGLITGIAPLEQVLTLARGDTLILTKGQTPGRPAILDDTGAVVTPASIPCTLPEVFGAVKPGERIWFDDGKLGGVIRSVAPKHVRVEITQAREKGVRLRSDKGINLPDSKLTLPALTEKDLQDLPFVARHADLVGLSFVQEPRDIETLVAELEKLGATDKAVVLKIETRRAFEGLPELLLAALRLPKAGIMIARGDLLVEVGYERLAEVQEEILWLCEAAHLPVIWATQVLESLAQKGLPSRAEITDAAMSERAECVMLNKGPHILEAIGVLSSILSRMQAHQAKKTPRLRRLHF